MNVFSALAYGARIHCDIDLSEHLSGGGKALCEIELHRTSKHEDMSGWAHSHPLPKSHNRDLYMLSADELDCLESAGGRAFEVEDVVTFSWLSGAHEVKYTVGPEGSSERVSFWFIHIFLPLYLSLERNFDFLHAGAVEVEGEAILFVAPSTGGKSTLIEYFLSRGHPLITDDKLATSVAVERLFAIPSHGCYRPYRRFEDLGHRAELYARAELPVRAIYLLKRVEANDDVVFDEIHGFRKFDRLMPHYIFGFRHLKARRLKYLASLVNAVPVYEVSVPHDLERLSEVHRAICEHNRKLQGYGK